ncbi:hypothetical protein AWB67_00511 [Caballeronia terrestris]|uniref:Uncharacterized protein n=1 Tax=Caballeronia terrestris TaxID=1226301 RepID=A0A158FD83_9BURK|nr:pyridoxamine 5'-phosphate oxidase family protein [Caballeronia terrestris]SAL17697.1 hypothetical protein AWB67_00511 [Caballeronia terrestris]
MTDSPSPGTRPVEQVAFDEWPSELRTLFDGTLIETKGGLTASLLAVDEAGRVRTSLLSLGELFAPDPRTLCFALWPNSRAAQAIESTGRATLTFVFDEAFFQVQLEARAVVLDDAPLACFVATIETGELQRVGYARLTSGICFELAETETVMTRWRAQVEMLKRAASAAA